MEPPDTCKIEELTTWKKIKGFLIYYQSVLIIVIPALALLPLPLVVDGMACISINIAKNVKYYPVFFLIDHTLLKKKRERQKKRGGELLYYTRLAIQ